MTKQSTLQKFKKNWKSGLTVSLVSIPLSVSLAVASGASPVMGIITAAWAGLIASFFGGSNFNVIGPTGALAGILAGYSFQYEPQILSSIAIAAGFFIFIASLLRLERYLIFVPGSAIHGFTLGVAAIIGLNQINFALGISGLPAKEKFIQNLTQSFQHIGNTSFIAFAIFVFSLAILMIFKKFSTRLPGAIFLAPAGIIVGYLASRHVFPFSVQTLNSLYPNIDSTLFIVPKFLFNQKILVPSLIIALIAILETMISAKIADGMTKTKSNKQTEMRGLALANIASGIMGGIPATAALARTTLNIKTGATNKISATISSSIIAAISLIFLNYFKYIPLAVIGAILVFVAIQMVEAEHFKRMFRYDRKNFYISLLVGFITVYEDPIMGIIFGTCIALLMLIEKLSRGQFELTVNNKNQEIIEHMTGEKLQKTIKNSDTIVYSIKGMLSYINSESHLQRFYTKLDESKNIILRLRSVYYIDIDGVEAIDEIIRIVESRQKNIYVTSINPVVAKLLQESPHFRELKNKGHVFSKKSEALRHLGFKIV